MKAAIVQERTSNQRLVAKKKLLKLDPDGCSSQDTAQNSSRWLKTEPKAKTMGARNGSTFGNFPKHKLESPFLQHESKIEDNLRYFRNKSTFDGFAGRLGGLVGQKMLVAISN